MRKPHIRFVLTVVASLPGLSLLAGCASQQPYADERLPDGQYQFLYPRQHYDSLDPWHRKELEQQALQEQVKSDRK